MGEAVYILRITEIKFPKTKMQNDNTVYVLKSSSGTDSKPVEKKNQTFWVKSLVVIALMAASILVGFYAGKSSVSSNASTTSSTTASVISKAAQDDISPECSETNPCNEGVCWSLYSSTPGSSGYCLLPGQTSLNPSRSPLGGPCFAALRCEDGLSCQGVTPRVYGTCVVDSSSSSVSATTTSTSEPSTFTIQPFPSGYTDVITATRTAATRTATPTITIQSSAQTQKVSLFLALLGACLF